MEVQKEVLRELTPKAMKRLRFPTNADQAAYMRGRQEQNRRRTTSNACENWMAAKLKATGKRFSRQTSWGYRVFDFWCAELGVAVEVDGPEHDAAYDQYRDDYNYRRSGILVLRVRNWNEGDAAEALARIAGSMTWKERRDALGLNEKGRKARRRWVCAP